MFADNLVWSKNLKRACIRRPPSSLPRDRRSGGLAVDELLPAEGVVHAAHEAVGVERVTVARPEEAHGEGEADPGSRLGGGPAGGTAVGLAYTSSNSQRAHNNAGHSVSEQARGTTLHHCSDAWQGGLGVSQCTLVGPGGPSWRTALGGGAV